MVATRGHRDNEVESKVHPQRECRRPRTNLQEPEDELIWESDDTVKLPKTRGSVTFECEKSISSHSGAKSFVKYTNLRNRRNTDSLGKVNVSEDENGKAYKKLRPRSLDVFLTRSSRGSTKSTWNSKRDNSTCHSCNEASPRLRKKVIRSCRKGAGTRLLNKDDDMIGVEGDTDTDDDIYRHRKSLRRRSNMRNTREGRIGDQLCHSPIKKEYVMNGDDDMTDKSDHENGLRRSLRQKPMSWILVDQKLRGYPNMIHSSEPENDELRPSRKASRRYIRQSGGKSASSAPQRRSQRFRKKSPEQRISSRSRGYLLREQSSRHHHPRSTRLRRLPLRYRESQSEDDDEEEEEENVNEDEEYEQDIHGEKSVRKSSRNLRVTNRTRARQRQVKVEPQRDSVDETENSDEEAEYSQRLLRKSRRRPGKKTQDFSEREGSSETEGKEDEEGLDKSQENGGEEEEENDASPKDKTVAIREKPKRERKPVARLTYEPVRRRRPRVVTSDVDNDEDDGDVDDDDEENDAADEEEEEEGEEQQEKERPAQRGRYSLRQNRKTLVKDPYESDESSRRHRKQRNRSDKMAKLFSSPARKHKIYNKKYRATHNTATSSSSSSSDEKEFEKRYSKSMAKARNRCLPMNFTSEDLAQTSVRDRTKIGSSLADIDPMQIDSTVSFDSVGGLSHHIKSLKEMIIFPLMYPEVFQKFSITPPRGVLFYGSPGTGKTLVARALAAECGQKDKKVAFFMRKGADCLSKWVGESERQLRLLFDQAYQMRPSIIFFDEIDGLAPVRSSRQDQIHSSIVSTLLALMDGLDSRGEVVVIGATNRIDAIDPALRRPGRFDREFHFPLPSVKARKQIINIHTHNWSPRPSKRLVHYLSEQTVGYCGADLKALCAEATLVALRLKYPQIYLSKDKLLLDVSKIHIKCYHFRQALSKIVPAGQRATSSPGRKLCKVVQPLLQPSLKVALRNLSQSFPHGFNKFTKDASTYCPRLLICGYKGQGQTLHLAPAILHTMEKVHTHKLDLPSLFSVSARAPEEACAQVFHEARRNLPSIIYIPLLDQLWNTVSETVRATFLSLLNDFEPSTPILLLATSETCYNEMDEEVQKLFSSYRDELLVMSNPIEEIRRHFFRPLFFTKMVQKPKIGQRKRRVLEPLPVAPPPQPRKLTANELQKIEEIEEATLRELRIFLRQICAKLAKNRMFYIFTKPVDLDEVPDYLDVIKTPMDLETMMTKIDLHQYQCAEDFLKHVDLICSNALEYNPDKNPEDKLIRHRACTLRDTAYAYIKAEMDTDFEMKCRDIRKARNYREQSGTELAPEFIKVFSAKVQNGVSEKTDKSFSGSSTPPNQNISNDLSKNSSELNRKKKRRNSWAKGRLSSAKKRKCIDKDKEDEKTNVDNEAEAKKHGEDPGDCDSPKYDDDENTNDVDAFQNKTGDASALCNGHLSTEDSRDSMKVTSAGDLLYTKSLRDSIKNETISDAVEVKGMKKHTSQIEAEESVVSSSEPGCSNEKNSEVLIDWAHLEAVYESCISVTDGSTVDQLQYLYNVLIGHTNKYSSSIERDPLLSMVELELRKFAQFRERH